MAAVAAQLGLHADIGEHLTWSQLSHVLDRGVPVICAVDMWGGSHWIVVQTYDDVSVQIMDPMSDGPGQRIIPRLEFEARWLADSDNFAVAIGPAHLTEAVSGDVATPDLPAADLIDQLLSRAVDEGTAALSDLVRAAVTRQGETLASAARLFTPGEQAKLTDLLAGVLASADLLGRSLVRDWARREEEAHAEEDTLGEGIQEMVDASGHEHGEGGRFASTGGSVAASLYRVRSGAGEPPPHIDAAGKAEREALFKRLYQPGEFKNEWPGEADKQHDFLTKLTYSVLRGSTPKEHELGPVYHSETLSSEIWHRDKGAKAEISTLKNGDYKITAYRNLSKSVKRIPAGAPDDHAAYIVHKALGVKPPDHLTEKFGKPKPVAESALHAAIQPGTIYLMEEELGDATPTPLHPEKALAYFKGLVPTLGVDPQRFGEAMRRRAFTLAAATEDTLLGSIQGYIADRLATGTGFSRAGKDIDAALDAAGVGPTQKGYGSMVFRTNAMDAYNTGADVERQDPDVIDTFPVWQYLGIPDGRERPAHRVHNDLYYPAEISFAEVRDEVKGEFDGYQCRCTSRPVSKWEWRRLYLDGARIAAGYRDVVPAGLAA